MAKLTAIEEMTAKDTIIDEVESLLWKVGHDLPEQDIKKCLEMALSNHIESLKEKVL